MMFFPSNISVNFSEMKSPEMITLFLKATFVPKKFILEKKKNTDN